MCIGLLTLALTKKDSSIWYIIHPEVSIGHQIIYKISALSSWCYISRITIYAVCPVLLLCISFLSVTSPSLVRWSPLKVPSSQVDLRYSFGTYPFDTNREILEQWRWWLVRTTNWLRLLAFVSSVGRPFALWGKLWHGHYLQKNKHIFIQIFIVFVQTFQMCCIYIPFFGKNPTHVRRIRK